MIAVLTCLVLAQAAGGAPAKEKEDAAKRPNVLMIAVDDLNDWVGCLGGHPQAKTPNFDRLARRGTLFTNAHCQSPLCNPSRSSLLTGLRPSTTGIYALQPGIRAVPRVKDQVTLFQYFAAHGYFTFIAGKVFHDGSIRPRDRANEVAVWKTTGGTPRPAHKFVETPDPIPAMDWGAYPERDEDTADWKTADATIAQLRSVPANQPFFLAAGFRLPHVPCYASKRWFDLYPEDSLVMPPVKRDDRDDVPEFAWYLHWKLPEPRLSWLERSHQWRPLVRAYLASISFMDSQVGRLLDALEESGQADRTIVVLWSDHGWHLGEKGISGKNSLWERSTHVPLIFAGPGVGEAAKCSQPVELLDIYPTLVRLCGLPPRTGLEGHSLVAQLQDANARRTLPAITTHNQNNHAVRSEHWRYIRYADGSEELYDHREDPNEWKNLASDPSRASIKKALAAWLPVTNAPPAPGSVSRLLTQENGVWTWEHKPIVASDKEP
jgi:arylsulfatase A-like enzyme